MDRQFIDDHHVVARYLADQLSESERAEFEACFLEHPEIVKEMETVARMKVGLMQLQASGELDRLTREKARIPRWQMFAAAAAIAAIAFGLSTFLTRNSAPLIVAASLEALGPQVTLAGLASTHQLMRTRGAVQVDAEIEAPVPSGAIQLQILPEYETPTNIYRVTVRRSENQTSESIATIDAVGANQDGFVPVFLSSAAFAPGTYAVELRGESAPDSETSVFTFRVR